jgi:hypothetical protein
LLRLVKCYCCCGCDHDLEENVGNGRPFASWLNALKWELLTFA